MNNVLLETIIRETGTLGVRTIPYVHRNIVNREIIPVQVDLNGEIRTVRVKVAKICEEKLMPPWNTKMHVKSQKNFKFL